MQKILFPVTLEEWDSGNFAVPVEDVVVDVSSRVALLDVGGVLSLLRPGGADSLVEPFIDHVGPFTVHTEDGLLKGFGVAAPADLTQDVLDAWKAHFAIAPATPFVVAVTRTESVTKTFTVMARCESEAQALALEEAHDTEFPRAGDADYSAEVQS